MNLKEAFRYQNFLTVGISKITGSIANRASCMKTTYSHNKSKADPSAEDYVELVESPLQFEVDDMVKLLEFLIQQKSVLSHAISDAKKKTDIDIDAELEVNRARQSVRNSLLYIVGCKPRKFTQQGRGYKFNLEGNQTSYTYDIDVTEEDAFDREYVKRLSKSLASESNDTSTAIESAMVNSNVEYVPPFDVSDSVEDMMEEFMTK